MINIVIPTYKQTFLKDTLDSIPIRYREKTYVVENGESLNKDLIESFGCNYIFEKETGANKARNTGWQSCDGEYVLFTDDDIQFHKKYFIRLEKLLTLYEPHIIGGKVELINTEPWVVESFAKALAELKYEEDLDFGCDVMMLKRPDHYLVGANMCIKRSFLSKHHGFDEKFGYHADRIPNDELHLLDKAKQFLYSPFLLVYHNVINRCNIEYMKRRFQGQAIADCRYYAQFEPDKKSLLKHHVVNMVNDLITHEQINKVRNTIKNEDITEDYIQKYIECRILYLNSFLKEIDNVY